VLIAIEEHISGFEIADVVADQIEIFGDRMRVIEGRALVVLKSQPQAAPLTAHDAESGIVIDTGASKCSK
jgi:hypothetical protein